MNTTVSTHILEELKEEVLNTAGITNMLPSTCKGLSDSIQKKTNKRISETTLKRVYGFANSKFNPSLFTIDAMAQYCDYKSWGDFCKQQEKVQRDNSSITVSWNILKQNAHKITNYTLQALKNRSGIPYNSTVSRQFINDHIDVFLQDNFTATAFIAPSGCGKTIALCHWIDEQLELDFTQDKNDIHLFFSCSALVNNALSGRSLNDWVLSLLGYDGSGNIASLLDEQQGKEGDFFLIIDNFDEYLFTADFFQLLLTEVVDIISLYKTHSWFKVILTMRSDTWINNKHTIINSRSNWFNGAFLDENRSVNVPLFDIGDINRLCENIYAEKKPVTDAELAGILSNPLYFQFYYQSNADTFCRGKIDEPSIHELISTYILNKIYLGAHATEKLILIKSFIDNMDFINETYTINKLKVFDLIQNYPEAYHDMLSIGYLKELNTSNDLKFENYIEFGNINYLTHAVAQVMLSNNNYVFDKQLIIKLNNLFGKSSYKLIVLKWIMLFVIKKEQHNNLEYIKLTDLSATEKSDLKLFATDIFEKKFRNGTEIGEQSFEKDKITLPLPGLS